MIRTIPKKVYMCYKIIDNNVLKKKNLWEELNPEYEIIVYDDNMCRDFLKKEYSDLHVNLFDFLKDGPIKSDFWRVCILNKYGGIYSDIDIKPLEPLRNFIDDNDEFVTFLSVSKILLLNPHFIKSFSNNYLLKQCINFYFYLYNIIKQPYKYWDYSIVTIMGLVLQNENIIDLSYRKTTQIFRKKNINFKFLEEKSYNACYYYNKLILLNRSEDYINHAFQLSINQVYDNIELKENEYIVTVIDRYALRKKKNTKNIYIVNHELQLFKLNSNNTLKKDLLLKKNDEIKKKQYLLTTIIEVI